MPELHESYRKEIKQESENIAGEININLVRPKPASIDDTNLEQIGAEEVEKVNFRIALAEEIKRGLIEMNFGSNSDSSAIDEEFKQHLSKTAANIVSWAMQAYENGRKFNIEGKGQVLVQTYYEGGAPIL
ncbi:MAG: hypothetical protein WAV73_04710 [Candidatus Moraniibacteriota bacterium]